MRFGFNMLLWTAHVTQEHFGVFPKLRATGYEGVEIPVFEGDATHFQSVRRALDHSGLKCSTVSIMTPEANPVSADPQVRQAAVDRLKWAIEMTAICGGDVLCGPLHSALGVFTGTGPTDDEKQRACDVLRQAAEFAATMKVTLAVEPLNRFECYFLNTAADSAQLVRTVGHRNCLAMFDTFHGHIEEKNVASAMKSLGGSLIHMHISENDRGIPGSGQVDWPGVFKTLKAQNFRGWLMVEAFSRLMPELAAATKIWRDLFPNPESVYVESLQFMKRMSAESP